MSTRATSKGGVPAERDEWVTAVDELVKQVETWARDQGWTIARAERDLTERSIGTYRVPVLEIHTPAGEVHLEPAGHDVLGARGRVDLYAWPSLYRVMLLLNGDGRWTVRTE